MAQYTYDLYNVSPAASLDVPNQTKSVSAANKVFGGYGRDLAMVQLQAMPDVTNKRLVSMSLHCYFADTQGSGAHGTYMGLITGNFNTSTSFADLYAMCTGAPAAYACSTNTASNMVDVAQCDIVSLGIVPSSAKWYDIDLTNTEIFYMLAANPTAYKGFWCGLGYRGQHTCRITVNNDNTLYVRLVFEDAYTQCSAPTSVNVSVNNVAPNAGVTLSWSGASAGQGMSIDHYDVYRSTDGGANYAFLQSVWGTSLVVSAPGSNGASYLYKVLAVGSVAGYNSGLSNAYATVTSYYTSPTAPSTVTIGGGTSAYAVAGANVTLAWSGASAGTNNPITGYHIYRDGVFYASTTATSYSVPANSTPGGIHTYTVYTLGTYSNSGASPGRTINSYSAPTAPTTVSVSPSIKGPGETATLSWSGAANGAGNPITGYQIFRATSPSGAYSLLTSVATSATSGSVTIVASADNGSAFYYKVLSVGSVSGLNSGQSTVYGTLTCSYSAPSAPSTVTIAGGTEAYATAAANVTLAWSGAGAGTNNPITGYLIYRDGSLYLDVGALTSKDVPAHNTAGGSYTYTVITKGTYSNSGASVGRVVYTYSEPTAPNDVTVSQSLVNTGASVLLSWSGAAGGSFNGITGYHIYRAPTANGAYTKIDEVASNATSGSRSVTAQSTEGLTYFFKIYTIGTRSNSALSSYAELKTNSTPTAPTLFTATPELRETGDITLAWSGQADVDGNYDYQEIQYTIRPKGGSYGAWAALKTAAGSSTTDTPMLNEGDRIKYQTRSVDTLGLTSAWVVSGEVVQNSAPTVPVFFNALPAAYESGDITLSWGGQTDPDSNYDRQEIEYSVCPVGGSYGTWAPLKTATGSSTTTTPTLDRGDKIKYRTRSVDALGKPSSDWITSNEVTRNLLPDAITVTAPAANAITYNTQPWLVAVLGVEPNGQTQQLQVSVDSGSYVNVGSVLGTSGGTVRAQLPSSLSAGVHTVSLRVMSGLGVAGTPVTRTFTVAAPIWTRDIVSCETIIYGSGHYHKPDIVQLQNRVNAMRAYYGAAGITLHGTVGHFADWLNQMKTMQAGLNECYVLTDRAAPSWINPARNYPRADIINQIRNAAVAA